MSLWLALWAASAFLWLYWAIFSRRAYLAASASSLLFISAILDFKTISDISTAYWFSFKRAAICYSSRVNEEANYLSCWLMSSYNLVFGTKTALSDCFSGSESDNLLVISMGWEQNGHFYSLTVLSSPTMAKIAHLRQTDLPQQLVMTGWLSTCCPRQHWNSRWGYLTSTQ